MSAVFADTYYFLAILNERDGAHSQAMEFSEAQITTAEIKRSS